MKREHNLRGRWVGNRMVYTVEELLDTLIQAYEMTKARHLLTIDVYDREYENLRKTIAEAIRNPLARPGSIVL